MAADTLGSYGSMARCYILPQSVFSDCFQLWELDDFYQKVECYIDLPGELADRP